MKPIFTLLFSSLLAVPFAFAQDLITPTPEKLAQAQFEIGPLQDSPSNEVEQPCNSPNTISCGQLISNQTTVGQTSNFFTSSYSSCTVGFGSTAYNAPDRLYRFTLTSATEVNISLKILTAGADLDIYLLSSCSPAVCITGSAGTTNFESVEAYLTQGTYWLVVDGFNGSQGSFNIQMFCTCNCIESTSVGRLMACENFETYANNDSISARSVRWQKWSNGVADGVVKSDASGKYLRCEKVGTHESDVLMNFGGWTLGRYRLSFKMFVETGKIGNYYVMHQFPDASGNNSNTAYRVIFNSDGNGYLRLGLSTTNVATFKYANGAWTNVVQIIDIDQNRADLWIDGEFVHSWAFNIGSSGNQARLEGINFDAHFVNYNYRVDDICLRTTLSPCFVTTELNTVCIENGTTVVNPSTARCQLFTDDEIGVCTNVCDFAGKLIYRGDNYSGTFTASDRAPTALANWTCVKNAYGGNVPLNLYADIFVFSRQDADIIGVGFDDNNNANVRGFVFVCSTFDVQFGGGQHQTGGPPDNSACIDGEVCWATLGSGSSTVVPINGCADFYYIVITGIKGETYSNLNVIPNGDCDSNPPLITCGQNITASISGSPNPKFTATSPAYNACYNGTRTYVGGEDFYKFTLTQPSNVTINLTATGGTPAPMGVFLYSFLCGENCLGYAENTTFNPGAVLTATLSEGSYYLVVDKALNSGSTGYTLSLNCSQYSPFLDQVTFTNMISSIGVFCPTDLVSPSHLVKLAYNPAYTPSDYFSFYFRNTNSALKGNTESSLYWHNSTQPLDFTLRGDDTSDTEKCSYIQGDTFFVFAHQTIDDQRKFKQFLPKFAPVSGGGVTDSLKFRPGGFSLITKLTEIAVVNFGAETSFLRTGPDAIALPFRFVSNQNWVVEESPAVGWLSASPTNAGTSKLLTLTFSENPDVTPRSTILHFYSPDAPDLYRQFVQIEQQGQCLIPQAVNILASNTSICQGSSATLTADVGAPYTDLYNYLWSTGATTNAITVSPNNNTTYSVTITNKYCFITSVDAQLITVMPRPNQPLPAFGAQMCAGQAVAPAISVGTQPPGVGVFWFGQASGGLALNGAASISFTPSPPPSMTTTYYAEATQNGCLSQFRTPVTLTVNTAPVFVTTDTVCNPNLLTYKILVTLTNGNNLSSSPSFPVTFSNGTFTIDNIPKGTNVTLTATNATCNATKIVTSPVCYCSFVAAPQSSGDKSYCIGQMPPMLLVAVNNGEVAEWYNQMAGGVQLGTGPSLQSTGPGTYWAQARNTLNMCTSARTPVLVTQNPLPAFNLQEKTCASDLSSYKVVFNTNANIVSATPYTVVNLGGDNYQISGITHGQPISIHLESDATTCVRDTMLESPQCGCPSMAKPSTNMPLVEPCEGSSNIPPLTVMVPPGMSANWYRNGQLQPGSPTLNLTTILAGTYWAKTYNPLNQCESADSTSVTLQYKPLPVLAVEQKQCDASWQTYQVTVSSSSTTLSSVPSIVPSNNGNGTYSFVGIPITSPIQITASANGCSKMLDVQPPICTCTTVPSAPQNPNNPAMCLGGSIPFLTVTVSNPVAETVDWYDVDLGGVPVLSNNLQFKPVSATDTKTYYAQAKLLQNGNCISNARTPVTLKVDLPATANAGQNATICSDEVLNLSGNIGGSAGSGTWSATPLGGTFSPNSSFQTATQYAPPNNFQNGNVTITLSAFPVQPSVCPTVSDQLTLTVYPTPSINIIEQVCEPNYTHYGIRFTATGDDIEFVPNIGVLNLNPDGSYTYGHIPEGIQVTIKTRFVTTGCDYVVSAPVKFCECPLTIPKPTSSGDYQVCVGTPLMPTLAVTVPPGFTVDWYNAPFNGTLLLQGDPTFENPPGPGDYWAMTRDTASNCPSTERTLVKITMVQLPNADAGLDQSACPGELVTLEAGSGGANYVYSWSNGQTGQSIQVPAQSATYILTVFLGNCSAKDSVQVALLPGAGANIILLHNISCFNTADGALNANGSGGSPPYSYAWSNGSSSQTLINLTAGVYSVIVTNAEGCSASTSATLTSPSPLVLVNTIVQDASNNQNNGSIQVSMAGGTPPYHYEWLLSNNNPVPNQSDVNTLVMAYGGNYRVRVTDFNGCVFISDLITIMNVVGTDEPFSDWNIQIFPNPAKDRIFVQFDLPESMGMRLEAFDMMGRPVAGIREDQVKAGVYEVNLEHQPSGLYMLKINLNGTVLTKTVSLKH